MAPPDSVPSPQIPPDNASSRRRSHRSKKHSHRGDAVLGRLYLVGFWVLARCYDLWIFFTTPKYLEREVLVILVPFAMLDTALFGAMLARQGWSRYILIIYHMYRVASSLIVVPMYMDRILADHVFLFRMVSSPIIDSLMVWALICSADIRRLVSRTYE